MGKQNNCKYCAETTTQHHLAKKYQHCIEEMNGLIRAEGEKKALLQDAVCINLDKVENCLAQKEKRNLRNTMDLCFGIAARNKNKQMVLCECRFNYQNPANLSKAELDAKIKYSKELVGNEIIIHHYPVFLFNTNLRNQAYSVLRRLYANRDVVKVLDVNELKQEYFS